MLRILADGPTSEPVAIATLLCDLLQRTYGDDVAIVRRTATVTIARGRRATQVQVLDAERFLVSLRHNQTFHMQPQPVDRTVMAGLVKRMIEARPATPDRDQMWATRDMRLSQIARIARILSRVCEIGPNFARLQKAAFQQ